MKTVYSERIECGAYCVDVAVNLESRRGEVPEKVLKEFEKFIENLYKIRTKLGGEKWEG